MVITEDALTPFFTIHDVSIVATLLFRCSYQYAKFWTTPSEIPETCTSEEDFFYHMNQHPTTSQPIQEDWNKIIDGLYLGRMPEKYTAETGKEISNDIDRIIKYIAYYDPKRPLGLAVCAMKYPELAGIGLSDSTPITPTDWARRKINHQLLLMPDYGGEAPGVIVLRVLFRMRNFITRGFSVFTHCKAGKGRSALLVLCYLVLFGNGCDLPPHCRMEDALHFLKSKRVTSINARQQQCAANIIALYYQLGGKQLLQQPLYLQTKTGLNRDDISHFLGSIGAKDAISELISFKELALYATKQLGFFNSNNIYTDAIRALFNAILQARDDTWYETLTHQQGPIKTFLTRPSNPNEQNDYELRKKLANNFYKETTQLIANALLMHVTTVTTLIKLPRSTQRINISIR